MKKICIAIGILIMLSSCYKELDYLCPESKGVEVFELSVSPEMQELIFTSTDTSYVIEEANLTLNDQVIYLKKLSIRGRTSLDYRRKSYSLKLQFPVCIRDRNGEDVRILESFKLISLAMDYTYINNRLAFGIHEEAGVMPLFYKFVEFRMNGVSQGVYLLLEDPVRHVQEEGSEYILRRNYHNGIRDDDYKPGSSAYTREEYVARFLEIYEHLTELEGETLFAYLDERLDLEQYFRKMGIDFLLRNGDYTDEVYLYSGAGQGAIRYRIIPWDYDDIFSLRPHEIGRSWAVGKQYGSRIYDTQQAIYDVIGDKLIYSIEDDLDYTIAIDSLLYARYEASLKSWLMEIEGQDIERLFTQLERELGPFYEDEDVISQSEYDRQPASLALWQDNMIEKKIFLLDRLQYMKAYLGIQ